jgi:hypothetical protein
MRIVNASEPLKRREHISFGTLSVVRYYDADTAEVRNCYFEQHPKARKPYRITIKVGICYLCKASQSQKTLWDRSESENLLSLQSSPKPENIIVSQRK